MTRLKMVNCLFRPALGSGGQFGTELNICDDQPGP